MAGVNKVILIGRLGKDPEVKYMANGTTVANFSVACSETWKDNSGEKKERTEWIKIVAFGHLAEICGEYLDKGKQVYIEGKLRTRSWEKDGQKHFVTEVLASQMQMLGGGQRQDEPGSHEPGVDDAVPPGADEDSVPF